MVTTAKKSPQDRRPRAVKQEVAEPSNLYLLPQVGGGEAVLDLDSLSFEVVVAMVQLMPEDSDVMDIETVRRFPGMISSLPPEFADALLKLPLRGGLSHFMSFMDTIGTLLGAPVGE